MKYFKLGSFKNRIFNSLMEMKEFLGLSSTDTVFDYCKRTGDVIYIYMRDTERTLRSKFHVIYDFKKEIGIL